MVNYQKTQAGFRSGRSCLDNIFILKSIDMHLRLKGRYVFCAFIDFKKAFDSINHAKFWKSIMNWPVNTPDYIVRLEADVPPLTVNLLDKLLSLWCRIQEMNNERLVKICLNRLIVLSKSEDAKEEWNWVM